MSDPEILTFGCRLNMHESEVMREHIRAAGLEDVIVVNSCAVTAEAVRQTRQAIRKARRQRPDAKIVVTGCAAQTDADSFAAMAEVDHVIGNDEKLKAETFFGLTQADAPRVLVNDIMSVRETAHHAITGFGARARAYVQIQNGCDHRCTFCIIPFGRGNSRSVPAGDVVRQIEQLVEGGYKEVVLTGVDITAYGRDLPGVMSFGRLIRSILKLVPDLERLRLSSIDSVEVDDDLLDVIANEPRLMPHLHLSLQSGDDMILKRMKRRHLRDNSIRFCEEVRALRPDIVYGADLIAGFPTESDEMFENTLRLIDECGLTYLHVFPFSPRPGTPAARMPQLERSLIKERAARLRARGEEKLRDYLEAQQGETVEVLMEREQSGRTPHFTEINVGQAQTPGSIVTARVTGFESKMLRGECLATARA